MRGSLFALLALVSLALSAMGTAHARVGDPEQQLRAAVAATLRRNVRRQPPLVFPSPAYGNPFLRDSFWAAQALGDRRFAVSVLNAFAANERADGDPPTWFGYLYTRPVYHDDESAALLLIWAWRNRLLYDAPPPRPQLQRALNYLLRRTFGGGTLITPAGDYADWWDAYVWPSSSTLSYTQGLYAVAVRCARLLGLTLPPHTIAKTEAAYRSLYDPRRGYLPLSNRLDATDASALTGEFLSLWLFKHPILSDAMALGTLRHLTPFGAGFCVTTLPGADPRAGTNFPFTPHMSTPGDYQNGASWLLYDAITIATAGLHGWPDALPRLRARLAQEFAHGVVLREYLRTSPSLAFYTTEPPYRDVFSWDAFVLVVDEVLRQRSAR